MVVSDGEEDICLRQPVKVFGLGLGKEPGKRCPFCSRLNRSRTYQHFVCPTSIYIHRSHRNNCDNCDNDKNRIFHIVITQPNRQLTDTLSKLFVLSVDVGVFLSYMDTSWCNDNYIANTHLSLLTI